MLCQLSYMCRIGSKLSLASLRHNVILIQVSIKITLDYCKITLTSNALDSVSRYMSRSRRLPEHVAQLTEHGIQKVIGLIRTVARHIFKLVWHGPI